MKREGNSGRTETAKTEIVYEDKDVLVVYKPAGLAVQTARIGQRDVVSELKNHLRQPYLGIVHRLDQPVEGLLVFAKNRAAAAALTAQLQGADGEGVLCKQYCAVLCGKPSREEERLVDYLYKNEDNRAVIVSGADAGRGKDCGDNGQEDEGVGSVRGRNGVSAGRKRAGGSAPRARRAALSYHILRKTESPAPLALAEITLETGRFHQIRAQMACHGLPLLGDRKYGDELSRRTAEGLCVKDVSLCACGLEFRHPVSGEEMRFRAQPRGVGFSLFSQT